MDIPPGRNHNGRLCRWAVPFKVTQYTLARRHQTARVPALRGKFAMMATARRRISYREGDHRAAPGAT